MVKAGAPKLDTVSFLKGGGIAEQVLEDKKNTKHGRAFFLFRFVQTADSARRENNKNVSSGGGVSVW